MNVRVLRWLGIAAPTAFIVVFEYVTHRFFDPVPAWAHALIALAAVSTAAFLFSSFMFGAIARLEEQVMERNRRLDALNRLALEVSQSLKVGGVAEVTTRNVLSLMGADSVGLALVDQDSGRLVLVRQAGLPLGQSSDGGELGPQDCECRKAISLGRPVVVEDSRYSPACQGLFEEGEPRTCLSVPICSKGRTIGAMFVARGLERRFTSGDRELLAAIGAQVGVSLENAQLHEKTAAMAALRERERMAREIHDGLAQTLGYLHVQLGILRHLLEKGRLDKVEIEVEEMEGITQAAYHELRQTIGDLRTPLPSREGVIQTLADYLHKFSSQTGISCHLEVPPEVSLTLPPAAEVQLMRIVQEALANVRKHAPGSRVRVSVEATARGARVIVRDNGPGFDPSLPGFARQQHFGLQTMRERAESVGGELRITSQPGQGTSVEVWVPLQEAKAA